ncbi:hypothetical protein J3B02_004316, partial [Coemansia erecta]
MSTELNVFIIVAISVSAVTIAVMVLTRRFRGLQHSQQRGPDGQQSHSQRYRIQPSRRRVIQFRPSNRPVKPYNPFSKDELQLLPTVTLTQHDVDRLNTKRSETFCKEEVKSDDAKEHMDNKAAVVDSVDGKVLE